VVKKILLVGGGTLLSYGATLLKNHIKSTIEEDVGDRILAEVKSMLMITLFWIVVILIVAGLSIIFNMENIASWIIDFILITYIIQGIIGMISALRIIREYQDSFFSGIIINVFSITITGVLQVIMIPLAGLGILYALLIALRTTFTLNFGGGFFSWVGESLMRLFF